MKLRAILTACIGITNLGFPMQKENLTLIDQPSDKILAIEVLEEANRLFSLSSYNLSEQFKASDTQKKIMQQSKALTQLQSFLTIISGDAYDMRFLNDSLDILNAHNKSLQLSIESIHCTEKLIENTICHPHAIKSITAIFEAILHKQIYALQQNTCEATQIADQIYHNTRIILSDISKRLMQPTRLKQLTTMVEKKQSISLVKNSSNDPLGEIIEVNFQWSANQKIITAIDILHDQLAVYKNIVNYFFLKHEAQETSSIISCHMNNLRNIVRTKQKAQDICKQNIAQLESSCTDQLKKIKRETIIIQQKQLPTKTLIDQIKRLHESLTQKATLILNNEFCSNTLANTLQETLKKVEDCISNLEHELKTIQLCNETAVPSAEQMIQIEPIHKYEKNAIIFNTSEENKSLKNQWKYSAAITISSPPEMNLSAEQKKALSHLLYFVSNGSNTKPYELIRRKRNAQKTYTLVNNIECIEKGQPTLILFEPNNSSQLYFATKSKNFYFYNPEQDRNHIYQVESAFGECNCIKNGLTNESFEKILDQAKDEK